MFIYKSILTTLTILFSVLGAYSQTSLKTKYTIVTNCKNTFKIDLGTQVGKETFIIELEDLRKKKTMADVLSNFSKKGWELFNISNKAVDNSNCLIYHFKKVEK